MTLTALGVLVVAMALGVGAAGLGDVVVLRQRAQAVADVTALAGVVGGAGAAGRVARANGMSIIEVRSAADGTLGVTVGGGRVAASAAAGRD